MKKILFSILIITILYAGSSFPVQSQNSAQITKIPQIPNLTKTYRFRIDTRKSDIISWIRNFCLTNMVSVGGIKNIGKNQEMYLGFLNQNTGQYNFEKIKTADGTFALNDNGEVQIQLYVKTTNGAYNITTEPLASKRVILVGTFILNKKEQRSKN